MNTMQLRCFFTAAQSLNFTQSANELFISQPAFSQNISSLEKEWGIELFMRSNKRKDTYLTPAGKMMYEGMKDLWDQYEGILQKARNIHEGKDGALCVGLSGADRIDERILSLLEHFQEEYPKIDISLLRGGSNELLRGLFNNTIDITFSLKIEVEDKKWLVYKELFCVETALLVNAKHPMAKKGNLSLSDFRNETFVNISSKESPAINALLKIECEKAGFTPKMIDAPDINSQALYMETGKGVAICSANNISAYKNRIIPLHLSDLRPMALVMAWNPKNDNPCIEHFVSAYELIN